MNREDYKAVAKKIVEWVKANRVVTAGVVGFVSGFIFRWWLS